MFIPSSTIIRASAWCAAGLVLGMIALFFLTGVGQDPLQFVHASEVYRSILLKNPAALRAVLGLDALFVVAYVVMFLAVGQRLLELGAARSLVVPALGFLIALGVLDMIENFHFLAMLGSAELGIAPPALEIRLQVWQSLIKFHVGYLGVFLFGLSLPRATAALRALSFACCWVSLLAGVAIYAVPQPLAGALLFVRFGFFVYALISVGWIFGAPRSLLAERSPSAAVGSSVPA